MMSISKSAPPLPAVPVLDQAGNNSLHASFAGYFFNKPFQGWVEELSRKMEEGHICLSKDWLEKAEFPGAPIFTENGWKSFCEHPWVDATGSGGKPFVVDGNRLYLQRYYQYETRLLNRLQQFIESSRVHAPERKIALASIEPLLNQLFPPRRDDGQTDWQREAAVAACLQDFCMITGGPGTGKTTTVAKVLALLWTLQPELKIALSAPTGKAAARMAESLKQAKLEVSPTILSKLQQLEPATLHRLLGTIPHRTQFKHHRNRPLPYDCIIVDESSMMDAALMSKLFDAVGPQSKLILLGDKNQLASVEAGSLFGDLCQINPQPAYIIELKESHRFKSTEGIGAFASVLIQGQSDQWMDTAQSSNGAIEWMTNMDLNELNPIIENYQSYINEPDIQKALQAFNQLRILCALREGPFGMESVNRQVEKVLSKRYGLQTESLFYEHQPVMITRNYYSLDLFNGDIGLARKDEHGQLKIWFEGKSGQLRPIAPALLTEVETAYAMTIHKSQGSEFEAVCIVLPPQPELPILTRELLYTAVTRAKKKVWILGTEEVITACVERNVERGSGIRERMQNLSIQS